jgi:hypothetical protein
MSLSGLRSDFLNLFFKLNKPFLANACINLFQHTNNAYNSIGHNYGTAMSFLKLYTLAGFEPGSFVPEANAMSTAPRRQGIGVNGNYFGVGCLGACACKC